MACLQRFHAHACASKWLCADDNPAVPYQLSFQQRRRSIMVMFEHVNTYQVRYAIGACCTTGRNFLLGGYSNMTAFCEYDPPSPPPLVPPPSPWYPAPCDEDNHPPEDREPLPEVEVCFPPSAPCGSEAHTVHVRPPDSHAPSMLMDPRALCVVQVIASYKQCERLGSRRLLVFGLIGTLIDYSHFVDDFHM